MPSRFVLVLVLVFVVAFALGSGAGCTSSGSGGLLGGFGGSSSSTTTGNGSSSSGGEVSLAVYASTTAMTVATIRPAANHYFAVIDLELTNDSSASIEAGTPMYRLSTTGAAQLVPDAVSAQSGAPCEVDVALPPGGSYRCTVIYAVPFYDYPMLLAYTDQTHPAEVRVEVQATGGCVAMNLLQTNNCQNCIATADAQQCDGFFVQATECDQAASSPCQDPVDTASPEAFCACLQQRLSPACFYSIEVEGSCAASSCASC